MVTTVDQQLRLRLVQRTPLLFNTEYPICPSRPCRLQVQSLVRMDHHQLRWDNPCPGTHPAATTRLTCPRVQTGTILGNTCRLVSLRTLVTQLLKRSLQAVVTTASRLSSRISVATITCQLGDKTFSVRRKYRRRVTTTTTASRTRNQDDRC